MTELDNNDNILTQGVWSPQTSQLPRSQLFAFPRSWGFTLLDVDVDGDDDVDGDGDGDGYGWADEDLALEVHIDMENNGREGGGSGCWLLFQTLIFFGSDIFPFSHMS